MTIQKKTAMVHIRLSEEMMKRIDDRRNDLTRCQFIRRAIGYYLECDKK